MTRRPATRTAANEYLVRVHRHHGAVTGWKFGLWLCTDSDRVCGLAVVGHPQSRVLQKSEPFTAEVLRLCTDGTYNACSFGYASAARVCRDMGYDSIITYLLATENGASLRASGWTPDRETEGGSWSRSSRKRLDPSPTCPKIRWRLALR